MIMCALVEESNAIAEAVRMAIKDGMIISLEPCFVLDERATALLFGI